MLEGSTGCLPQADAEEAKEGQLKRKRTEDNRENKTTSQLGTRRVP